MLRDRPLSRVRKSKIIGRLHPDELYTVEGCKRFGGLSRNLLLEARQAGHLKSYPCGKRMYYRGKDLVALILSGFMPKPRTHSRQAS